MSSEGTEVCKAGCAHCAWQASDEGRAEMASLKARTDAAFEEFIAKLRFVRLPTVGDG